MRRGNGLNSVSFASALWRESSLIPLPLLFTGNSLREFSVMGQGCGRYYSISKGDLHMRAVVTRVTRASVSIDGAVKGQIGQGFLILLGVTHEDTEAEVLKLADKICGLRIFEDENGKMNLGLDAVNGELLIISQFTLYGSCKRGRRPDFLAAARPEVAIPLYEAFIAACREKVSRVETGEFGADMKVDSVNDGPLTLILDTDTL